MKGNRIYCCGNANWAGGGGVNQTGKDGKGKGEGEGKNWQQGKGLEKRQVERRELKMRQEAREEGKDEKKR